ncbi:MAG: T9SS type A sorting domain-containing protein [Chlorobi bacterium]|nr:T9SS type A sorting domain-containing protein [Chlorobiota bacterium]
MKTFFISVITLLISVISANIMLAQIPDGYYDSATGLEGNELKNALHDIIDNHTELDYDDLWDVLKESDEDPNNSNNFILIYTGRSISKSSSYPDWNREHVWAKSHGDFDTDPPAGTDAHHIRPADVSVNSDRGSLDFDNGGTQHDEATECYYDSDSWEPRDAVKGDIARMMFYMAVRYEGDDTSYDLELLDYTPTSGEYFGKLSTLLQWNEDDPVDDFERHRNEVVYSYQHNRNPFVDHPEWVNCIWANDCSSGIYEARSNNPSSNIKIFPDPAISELNIKNNLTISSIKISNVTGQTVLNANNINNINYNLNIANLTKGIYFLIIKNNNGTYNVKKFVKR